MIYPFAAAIAAFDLDPQRLLYGFTPGWLQCISKFRVGVFWFSSNPGYILKQCKQAKQKTPGGITLLTSFV